MSSQDNATDAAAEAVAADQAMAAQDAVTFALRELQARVEDVAVRAARHHGWCDTFEQIMNQVFPNGPLTGSEFRDSNGWSCRGFDVEGFNANGVDRDGYLRDGFNDQAPRGRDRKGFDRTGYDRLGFNRDGVNAEGVDRNSEEYKAKFKYNRHGYDRDGYNAAGLNRNGYTREQQADLDLAMYVYDAELRDHRGVDYSGYRADGSYVGRA